MPLCPLLTALQILNSFQYIPGTIFSTIFIKQYYFEDDSVIRVVAGHTLTLFGLGRPWHGILAWGNDYKSYAMLLSSKTIKIWEMFWESYPSICLQLWIILSQPSESIEGYDAVVLALSVSIAYVSFTIFRILFFEQFNRRQDLEKIMEDAQDGANLELFRDEIEKFMSEKLGYDFKEPQQVKQRRFVIRYSHWEVTGFVYVHNSSHFSMENMIHILTTSHILQLHSTNSRIQAITGIELAVQPQVIESHYSNINNPNHVPTLPAQPSQVNPINKVRSASEASSPSEAVDPMDATITPSMQYSSVSIASEPMIRTQHSHQSYSVHSRTPKHQSHRLHHRLTQEQVEQQLADLVGRQQQERRAKLQQSKLTITFTRKPLGCTLYEGNRGINAWVADVKPENKHISDGLRIGLYVHTINGHIVDNRLYQEILHQVKSLNAPITLGFNHFPPLDPEDEVYKSLCSHFDPLDVQCAWQRLNDEIETITTQHVDFQTKMLGILTAWLDEDDFAQNHGDILLREYLMDYQSGSDMSYDEEMNWNHRNTPYFMNEDEPSLLGPVVYTQKGLNYSSGDSLADEDIIDIPDSDDSDESEVKGNGDDDDDDDDEKEVAIKVELQQSEPAPWHHVGLNGQQQYGVQNMYNGANGMADSYPNHSDNPLLGGGSYPKHQNAFLMLDNSNNINGISGINGGNGNYGGMAMAYQGMNGMNGMNGFQFNNYDPNGSNVLPMDSQMEIAGKGHPQQNDSDQLLAGSGITRGGDKKEVMRYLASYLAPQESKVFIHCFGL